MIKDWTLLERWTYAIKPASWPKLLVPMFLGQALGVALTGDVDLRALAWGAMFTILDGLFIVLMNDWGDRKVDALKRQMFPDGCSPKTIPDGILPAKHIALAGAAAALLAGLVGWGGQVVLDRPGLAGASVLGLALFALYTLPPFRLNYRGGGELLEMAGVGVVLPWLNIYAQSGHTFSGHHMLLGGFAMLALASALASGLSDEESDRRGGKHTFTTMLGNTFVRRCVRLLIPTAILLWVATALSFEEVPWWPVAMASMAVTFFGVQMSLASSAATTNQFKAQKEYKAQLHQAIWYGAVVLGTGCMFETFFSWGSL